MTRHQRGRGKTGIRVGRNWEAATVRKREPVERRNPYPRPDPELRPETAGVDSTSNGGLAGCLKSIRWASTVRQYRSLRPAARD